MRALKLLVGLILALVAHFVLAAVVPEWAGVIDPFLLLIVFVALDGGVLGAVLAGCAVGLAQDAVTNGLFGVYGLAGTVVGFTAARSAQLLSLERIRFVALLFCLSAIVQQIVALVLIAFLIENSDLPALATLAARIVLAGFLGSLLVLLLSRLDQTLLRWRHNRQPRVRWGIGR